jgi:RecA/RadA recombinase
MISESQGIVSKLANEINAMYGSPIIRRASEFEMEKVKFGVDSLDIDTEGGAPRGRGVIVVGEESSFKSSLTYSLGGNAQRICGNCFRGRLKEINYKQIVVPTEVTKGIIGKNKEGKLVSLKYIADGKRRNFYCPDEVITHKKDLKLLEYELECPICDAPEYSTFLIIDAEQNYKKKWAMNWGVVHKYVELARTTHTQQIGEIIRSAMKLGRFSCILVDSVDAQGPLEEEKSEFQDWQMGLQARVWNKIVRSIHGKLNTFHEFKYYDKEKKKNITEQRQTEPIVVLVQQFRESIGAYGDPKVFGGGRGKKYLSTLTIGLMPGEKDWKEKGKMPEDRNMTGRWFNYDIIKHKAGRPHRQGRFYFSMEDNSVINSASLVILGVKYGLIERKGSWYSYADLNVQGQGKLALALEEDNKLRNKLFLQIYRKRNKDE